MWSTFDQNEDLILFSIRPFTYDPLEILMVMIVYNSQKYCITRSGLI